MIDSIETALNQKERQCIIPNPFHVIKEVWLLVHEKDLTAQEYCKRVLQYPGIKAELRQVGSEEDMKKFLNWLYERAYEALRNPIKKRQYFLFVTSNLDLIFQEDYSAYREEFAEYEYELLYLSRMAQNPKKVDGYMRCLIVNPRDYNSGLILALEGSTTFPRFSQRDLGFEKEYAWYRMRTDERSAFREDIYKQIYSRLYRQMTGETKDVINQKLLNLEGVFRGYIQELCGSRREFPIERDLPLVGYGRICGQLEHLFPRLRTSSRPRETGMTIGQALSILYGNEQDLCRPEKLRQELSMKHVGGICEKTIQSCHPVIVNWIFNNFTLYDIYSISGIAGKATSRKDEYQREADCIEGQLLNVMHQKYLAESCDPRDLQMGLQSYFELWDRYVILCFWKEWWEGISNLVTRRAVQDAGEYRTLMEIYKLAEENIDPHQREEIIKVSKAQNDLQNSIRCVQDILKLIQSASAARNYTEPDIARLIDRETRQIIEAKDIGTSNRRPRMCLLANNQILKEKEHIHDGLDWLKWPAPYVPVATAYIVTMYAVLEEEVLDDQV